MQRNLHQCARSVLVLTVALVAFPATSADAALLCREPVARATWVQEPQGARIKVFPTSCGRRTAWVAPRPAFRRALRLGSRPATNRRSLFAQFRCHAVFAPYKRSWNLETWRPVVSSKRMVRTLCNPNGRATRSVDVLRRRGLFATVLAVLIRRR